MVRTLDEPLNESEEQLLTTIDKSGWQVTAVFAEGDSPSFAYSTGIYKSYDKPELLVIGLNTKSAAKLVNLYGAKIKTSKFSYESGNFYSDFLDDWDVYMTDANSKAKTEYTLSSQWYYNGVEFPLMQCVWPSVKGFWPWDQNAWEDNKSSQPLFGEPPKETRFQ